MNGKTGIMFSRDHLLAGVAALLLAAAIASVWNWDGGGPNPDHAFIVILTYFGLIAVVMCAAVIGSFIRRPPGQAASDDSFPPPPEPSPAALPPRPKAPGPLVVHAQAGTLVEA